MSMKRKIIEINEELCNGCGDCVPSCHEGAIKIIDGKAKLVADKYCDGLGDCLAECPTGALKIVERDADGFDEEAVEEHLYKMRKEMPPTGVCPGAKVATFSGGCPSSRMASFDKAESAPAPSAPEVPAVSELTHWPIQIKLVPPGAPFLNGKDLLVAADCVPVSYARFHQDFLKDKSVMIGCPKFDDYELYQQRFTDIFKANDIKSVTVVVMVVPCCQGLHTLVRDSIAQSGKDISMKVVTISLQGEIL